MYLYFNFTLLSFVVLCLLDVVIFTWVADIVEFNLPWHDLLVQSVISPPNNSKGKDVNPRDSFEFYAFMEQQFELRKDAVLPLVRNPAILCGSLVLLALLGHIVNNSLLCFLLLNPIAFIPGFLQKEFQRIAPTKKDQ